MKSFDLFQKVTVDNASKSTLSGALISLAAISIMLYVVLKSLNEYFFIPLIQKDSIIFQDKQQTLTIPYNIGITFKELPCSIISVDQEDLIGHHRLNIAETVNKIPLDSSGSPNNNHYDARYPDKLMNSIKNKEGCFVEGYIPISKVQGDVHISFHAYRDIFSYMIEKGIDKNISLAHKFSLFNFGNKMISEKMLEKFNLQDQKDSFYRVNNLPNFEVLGADAWKYDFDYFVKIIPQVFEDEYTGESETAYQFSLTSKKKKRENEGTMPVIMINYDYSSVAMKFTMKKRYFSHLITNICAIVGGIFVIFSIVNGILNSIKEVVNQEQNTPTRRTIN